MLRRGLFQFELRWMRVVSDVLAPAGLHPDVPEAGGVLGGDKALDVYFRIATPLGAIGYRAALWALWFLPLLVIGRPRTLGGLPPNLRDRYLTRLVHHRVYLLRQLVFLLKLAVFAGYFDVPRVRKAYHLYEEDAIDLPVASLSLASEDSR